ncbi:MAG: hypothetical protein JXM71_01240 [Spirochaetales bacterium]|nr:hypothetical protein [Spirochaetales bacterium]
MGPRTFAPWVLSALLSHSAWGAYPVLARYLQNTHHLGTMSLSMMTNTLALVILIVIARPYQISTYVWHTFDSSSKEPGNKFSGGRF